MAPLAVCGNHPVAATISSRVAPSGARSMAISVACLVPSRGVRALGAGFGSVGVFGAGCSLGDDDDENGGEAAADTGDGGEAAPSQEGGGNLLQEVQDRGTLRCGVNDAVPGFGRLYSLSLLD